jgi:hypothetical protein
VRQESTVSEDLRDGLRNQQQPIFATIRRSGIVARIPAVRFGRMHVDSIAGNRSDRQLFTLLESSRHDVATIVLPVRRRLPPRADRLFVGAAMFIVRGGARRLPSMLGWSAA